MLDDRQTTNGTIRAFVPRTPLAFAVVTLIVVVSAIVSVVLLVEHGAHTWRDQTLLAEIQFEAGAISTAEWSAMAQSNEPRVVAANFAEVDDHVAHVLEKLGAVKITGASIDRVRTTFVTYHEAVDAEFELLVAGKKDEAIAADEANVDPAFDDLSAALDSAIAERRVRTEATTTFVRWSLVAILVCASSIVAYLLAALTNLRTEASHIESQRRILDRANANLQDEVTARRETEKELTVAKIAAEKANGIKSDFLATMSHEIRTPINGIIGMTEALLRTRLDDEQLDFAKTAQLCSASLLELVNDILDISKLEAGKLELEDADIDVRTIVDESMKIVGLRAGEKKVALSASVAPDVPACVRGDSARLRQVLLNLASNAIKFTDLGSVAVRWTCTEMTEGIAHLRCEVEDTGIGIAPESMHRLFQAFSQADASTTRRFGGTGLGLVISRRIIEAMGGKIGVESKVGVGSTFWFTIPAKIGDAASNPTSDGVVGTPDEHEDVPVTTGRGAAKILVAEDNPVNRKVVSTMLKRLGYEADYATSGVEALAAMRAARYAIVLMDCQMPQMDGYDATREIRRAEGDLQHTPIVAMTANVMAGDRERCIESGMDDYVAKPFHTEDLAAVLKRWIA